MKWVVAFVLCGVANAATIADLQATSSQLAEERGRSQNRFGGTATLTTFKHQLRDWVESRLTDAITNAAAFARGLNGDLERAGLLAQKCSTGERRAGNCDSQNRLGKLCPVSATINQGMLILEMGPGILCGCDISLYAYERSGARWVRRLASEELNYQDSDYSPREYDQILVSTPDANGARKLLTIGKLGWCTSVWHPIQYRYYRIGETAKMLIDGSHTAYVGKDPPAHARLDPDGFLLEFSDLSSGSYSRPIVLRYQMRGDEVRRVEPIALRPHHFIEEWVSRPWEEVAEWTNQSAQSWHQKVFDLEISGEHEFVQRCAVRQDLWQVGVTLKPRTKVLKLYFLIEDQGEYRFRARDVSETRQPGCPGESQPDSTTPTLFPQKSRPL